MTQVAAGGHPHGDNQECHRRPGGQYPGRGQTPSPARSLLPARRCHFGWSPASPHQERPGTPPCRANQAAAAAGGGCPPGPTPTTPRILTGSRRRNWPPGPPAPARSAPCLIRTPAQRAERRACSCRMRPGATPCLLDARARQQAPGHRGVRPPLSCQRGMAAPRRLPARVPNSHWLNRTSFTLRPPVVPPRRGRSLTLTMRRGTHASAIVAAGASQRDRSAA